MELLARAGSRSGSQECGAVGPFALAAYLPSALQASLWAPSQSAPPAPTHCLLPLLGSAPSSHKSLGREGVGSHSPSACPSPHPWAQDGLMVNMLTWA